MSKIIYQDKTFLQELAEIPEINKVTDNNMNSIKKAVNENGQYVSATESNGEFTCTLEGSINQNDIVHILFDTSSTASPASLSVDGGNTFLNILDASGNSINASELSGQSVSVKNAGSHFEIETLNSYSNSKAMSYSANYINNLIDGVWQNVTLSANWASLGSAFNTLQCRKVGNKIELRGGIDKSTTKVALETFATLPAEYRPAKRVIAGCLCGPTQIQRIDIYPSGEINLAASVNSTCQFLIFDGLCFYTD
jgi:hypothetical protein